MKLYHTHNSPYARRARLALRASGIQAEEIDVSPLHGSGGEMLRGFGPGGKVPGLMADDGSFISETLIITGYLNQLSGGKLMPADPKLLEIEAIASLLLDCLFLRSHELRAEDGAPSQNLIDKETARIARCYDALDTKLTGQAPAMNLAHIAAVAALGYANWRAADDNWRSGRDGLAAWYDAMMENTDVAETAPNF